MLHFSHLALGICAAAHAYALPVPLPEADANINTSLCVGGELPPDGLAWLMPDDAAGETSARFFYVNQQGSRGRNRVAQLLNFPPPRLSKEEGTRNGEAELQCELLFSLPEDVGQFDQLVQQDGSGAEGLRLNVYHQEPTAPSLWASLSLSMSKAETKPQPPSYETAVRDSTLVGTFEVRPGTQTLALPSCAAGAFVFTAVGEGTRRVAFRQALAPQNGGVAGFESEDPYGVFFRYGCGPRGEEISEL